MDKNAAVERSEGLKLKVRSDIRLYDKNGKLKDSRLVKNLITNDGFDLVADLLGKVGPRPSRLTNLAIGTGTTAATAVDDDLDTEADRVTGTVAARTGTGAITEAGAFNASSGGTMFSRRFFNAVNKSATVSMP